MSTHTYTYICIYKLKLFEKDVYKKYITSVVIVMAGKLGRQEIRWKTLHCTY